LPFEKYTCFETYSLKTWRDPPLEEEMPIYVLVLMIAGGLFIGIGSLWFLSVAFRFGVLWGLLCLFVPFAALIFLITHWDDAKRPFLLSLLGGLLFGASMGVAAYEESQSASKPAAQTTPVAKPTIRPTPAIVAVTPSPAPEVPLPTAMLDEATPTAARSLDASSAQPPASPAVTPTAQLPQELSGIVHPPRAPQPPTHVSIELENLSEHQGEILRFRMSNGRSFEGRIREVGEVTVKVERNTNAGKMTFDIKLADIEEVLKRL
jgi:hypothetical protein